MPGQEESKGPEEEQAPEKASEEKEEVNDRRLAQADAYDELRGAFQRVLHGGVITPEIRSLLYKHEMVEVPQVSNDIVSKCSTLLGRLNEPMRDEELGILARREIPLLASTLLVLIPVVRDALIWRAMPYFERDKPNSSAQALEKSLDDLLSRGR